MTVFVPACGGVYGRTDAVVEAVADFAAWIASSRKIASATLWQFEFHNTLPPLPTMVSEGKLGIRAISVSEQPSKIAAAQPPPQG